MKNKRNDSEYEKILNQADNFINNNRFDKALSCFDKAIKLNSKGILPVIGKAIVFSQLNDYENADKYFNMAEKIDNNDINFLFQKGIYLLDKFEFQKSIEYFDRCLEIHGEGADILMFKSMALSELGRDFESEKCFKKAINLDPDSINVFDDVIVIEE